MSATKEIDVTLMSIDELADYELEIPHHELTFSQKVVCVVEIGLLIWLAFWTIKVTIFNVNNLVDIMSKSFIH